MARPRRNFDLEVVGSVGTEDAKETVTNVSGNSGSGDYIFIACHLNGGVKFDGVPDSAGGTKTVVFPGVNDALRGKRTGILLGKGNSVAVKILRTEWQWIKDHYGDSGLFKWNNGVPPCLIECNSLDEFNSKEEVKGQTHGYEPADPTGVEAA